MSALGSYYPAGVNVYVPSMQYAADVDTNWHVPVNLSPLVALATADTDGILAAQSIAAAVDTTTFAAAFAKQNTDESLMGRFGRNVTVVASGAATSNVTVYGYDYLGQPMAESFTLAKYSDNLFEITFKEGRLTDAAAFDELRKARYVSWGNLS